MTNHDLAKWLELARVPERSAAYWAAFPKAVTQRLQAGREPVLDRCVKGRGAAWVWVAGLAAAGIAVGFILGIWQGLRRSEARQWAAMQKCFQEISALFPNQVRGIVLDEHGLRLVLAQTTTVASSPPLAVQIRQGRHWRGFVTFSGQHIEVNGELCEVLMDGQGHILLIGRKLVWSSAQPTGGTGLPYRIRARALEAAS